MPPPESSLLESRTGSIDSVIVTLFPEAEKISLPKGIKSSIPIKPSADNFGIARENISLPLDGVKAIYPLDDLSSASQLAFFKLATGIQDSALLKSHLMEIRQEAYKCYPYPCIWGFEFLKGKTRGHPFYSHIKNSIRLQGEASQEIYIELGTFMGIDLRQVVRDGWKPENVLGVDVHREWNVLGCRLFRDGDSAPPFFLGDIFQSSILDASTSAGEDCLVLNLRALKDLNDLKGRARFICTNQLFHLFSEKDQRTLANRCGLLLSDKPGSAIFGTQLGASEEGMEPYMLYLHSPESWKKLWKDLYGNKVEVTAELEESHPDHCYRHFNGVERLSWLHWSVLRV